MAGSPEKDWFYAAGVFKNVRQWKHNITWACCHRADCDNVGILWMDHRYINSEGTVHHCRIPSKCRNNDGMWSATFYWSFHHIVYRDTFRQLPPTLPPTVIHRPVARATGLVIHTVNKSSIYQNDFLSYSFRCFNFGSLYTCDHKHLIHFCGFDTYLWSQYMYISWNRK